MNENTDTEYRLIDTSNGNPVYSTLLYDDAVKYADEFEKSGISVRIEEF